MVVYLIGAGPGDADLITLKAVKALNKADVVLYDYLANEEILVHAPDDAEKIYVGKKAGEHYKTQDQINELIIDQAQKHENVVDMCERLLCNPVIHDYKINVIPQNMACGK